MSLTAQVVGKGSSDSGSPLVTAAGTTAASGSSFFAFSVFAGGNVQATPTDNYGNTYTLVGTRLGDTDGSCALYQCLNGSGGAGHVLTQTLSVNPFGTLFLIEVTGDAPHTVDDVSQGNMALSGNPGAPLTITSGTLAQAIELALICGKSEGGGGDSTFAVVSGGATILDSEPDGGRYFPGFVAALTTAATTPISPSFSSLNETRGSLFIVTLVGTAADASAALAWTEADDAAALAGTLSAAAALAWTEANDVAALVGAGRAASALAWTEANDAAALTGSAGLATAALAWTESNDACAMVGLLGSATFGTLAWTEANDAAALAGALRATAAVVWTEASDAAALAGVLQSDAAAALAWIEANDVALLVVPLSVAALIAWIESNDGVALVPARQVTLARRTVSPVYDRRTVSPTYDRRTRSPI